jgi:hypothetical protein
MPPASDSDLDMNPLMNSLYYYVYEMGSSYLAGRCCDPQIDPYLMIEDGFRRRYLFDNY